MRRTWILIGLLFAAALGAQTDSAPNGGSGRHLRRLETNADPHPLAIEPGPPRFSWTIECPFGETAKGPVRQTAWRVRVYDDTASEKDAAPVWDSGLTRGDTGVDVPYSGPPLRGLARYRFTVDVQISVNGVDVAEPLTATDGRFETGPGAGEWRAAWIGAPLEHPIESAYLDVGASWYWTGEGDARVDAPAGERTFRTFYEVDAKSLSGTTECVITGDDEVAVWINNVHVLSHANHREYRRVDISDRLVAGRNVIVLKAKNAKGPAGLSGYIVTTPPAPDGMPVVSDFLAPAFWTAEAIDVLKVPESDPKIWKSVRRVAAAGESPWGRPRMIRSGLPATALRRSFSLPPAAIRAARLYATALGAIDVRVNGEPMRHERSWTGLQPPRTALRPDWTDYRKRTTFDSYDVTELLKSGEENVLALSLGDGWYGGALGWALQRQNFGDYPISALVMLVIDDADGKRTVIGSDELFKSARCGLRENDLYGGERFDARREPRGWMTKGFDDRGWRPAAVRKATPAIAVEPRIAPPIVVADSVPAVAINEPKPGVFVVDFGRNIVGHVQVKASGPRGTEITMRHAEILNPDGTIYRENLRRAEATDVWTLAGDGEETYEPTFTYHGFRYVELTGWPGKPALTAIQGAVVHTDLECIGGTYSADSNEESGALRTLVGNIKAGIEGNMMSVPTDCPQRDERLGWMGDAQIIWPTACSLYDMRTFTRKWAKDIRDAQSAEGGYSDVSPRVIDPADGAPAWGDAGILVPYVAFLRYDDRTLVREHWDSMERWMKYIGDANPDFIWLKRRNNDFGDWVPAGSETPKDLIATAYWAKDAQAMAEMAESIGRTVDVLRYSGLFASIKQAFTKRFVHEDGTIGNGSQTCYALAIDFNLLDEGAKRLAGEKLVADIRAHGDHLTTGFLGTGSLMNALSATGHDDVAFDLLFQKTYPSWRYMIEKGATTIWERWNGDTGDPGMNSFNHYAFGAVGDWLFAHLAGVRPLERGYRSFLVRPLTDRRFRSGISSGRTPFGDFLVEWSGNEAIEVRVPARTTAEVEVAAKDPAAIKVNGIPATAKDKGFEILGSFAGVVRLRLGSGLYGIRTE